MARKARIAKLVQSSAQGAPTAQAARTWPKDMSTAIAVAVQNIDAFGDTDIFPFSFEQHILHDRPELLHAALKILHDDFEATHVKILPDNINTLVPVGYMGFRWATQIDPLWNCYYLSLVIAMSEAIEKARIPSSERTVYSYRLIPPSSDGKIFDDNYNWLAFMKASQERAADYSHVIMCDIADFYARIYHHRVENALKSLGYRADIVKRIMDVLQVFTGAVSYGLPVGGPASRVLAELALNNTDKLLRGEGIPFCRFVDDYRIFCRSKEEAYQYLILLSEKLFNEGLSLQRSKTRILASREFMDEASLLLRAQQAPKESLTEEGKLLKLAIHFDPYSDTSVEDYDKLKKHVSKIDVAGIFGRELRKTRIDTTVVKQAIEALRVLNPNVRKGILTSLLQVDNLQMLLPVFSKLMTVLRAIYLDLDDDTQTVVERALIALIKSGSHITRVDLNLAYMVQVLRKRHTAETEAVFVKLFRENGSALVRREIILAWNAWQHTHSLSDIKKRFRNLSKWERRAFIVASYALGDEGKHWRQHNDSSFDQTEEIVKDWYSKRVNSGKAAPL